MGQLDKYKPSMRLLAAALLGALAWRGDAATLAMLPAVIWLWRDSKNRLDAFYTLFAYYLAASHGLIQGAGVFFSDPFTQPTWWAGVLIWMVPNAILAVTWAACWSYKKIGLRLLLALGLISLPPIGVVGWANPLTAAGILFPSTGWFGLGLILILFYLMAERQLSYQLIAPLMLLMPIINVNLEPLKTAPGWIGLDTRYLPSRSVVGEFERMKSLQQLITQQSRKAPSGTIFLLPEAVGGDWTINDTWWQRVENQLLTKKQTVVIGAKRPDPDSRGYINMLTTIGDQRGSEFINRVPVPLGMWMPHRADGIKTRWWGTGISAINNVKVASLICYEQLLIWPILLSMIRQPDVLIGASNGWWARATNIPEIQRQVLLTWGRLFAIPTVWAVNR